MRFRLSTLIALVSVAAILFAIMGKLRYRERAIQRAILSLKSSGADIGYERDVAISVRVINHVRDPVEFTDADLVAVRYLTRLEVLFASDVNITDKGLAALKGLSRLVSVSTLIEGNRALSEQLL